MVQEIESLQTQIQRILQSKAFRTSEVQRNLLAYLADKSIHGTADSLKEYTIGLDVFGKPASYDPRQESAVRMHVGRLRQKLADYYRLEGTEDPVVVDLPKGGFRVTFEPRAEAQVVEIPQIEPPPAPRYYRREIALALALLLTLACAVYFGTRLWHVERTAVQPQTPGWTPELQQLWAPILASNRPLMICLSTTPSAAGVTTIGTANGAFYLGQFLGERKKDIQLTPSDQLSMPEIAMGNVVFVGPSTGSRESRAVPEDRQLILGPDGIRNVSPRPGEPALLADRNPSDPQDVAESYALISHFPGLNGNGELLYFSGNKIPAVTGAVQAFTDPAFARTLVAKMKTAGGALPHYYQVVLKIRSMDEMPIDVSYVFHRDLESVKAAAVAGQ